MIQTLRLITMVMIATSLTTTGRQARTPEAVPQDAPAFSVMSYNVLMTNVARGTSQAITDANPDIVCLQETTDRWDKFLVRQIGDRYGYRVLGPHSDSWNGVSVFSKFPIRDIHVIPAQDEGWFESIEFTADTSIGPVQILNVHLRPMIRYHSSVAGFFTIQPIHRREVAALIAHLDPNLPHLIVGDFNEDDSGQAVKFLSSTMTNALPEFDFETPTWHGPVAAILMSWRLDHTEYSRSLHCYSAGVLKRGDSDHYPVVATLGAAKH